MTEIDVLISEVGPRDGLQSIDTIMCLGPIKFNVLVKIIGIKVISCNLFNM